MNDDNNLDCFATENSIRSSLDVIISLKLIQMHTRAYKEVSSEENSVVNDHCSHLPLKFSVNVKVLQDKLPTMYCYLSFIKNITARFIANSISCTTTELSKLLNFLPHCCQNPCHKVLRQSL